MVGSAKKFVTAFAVIALVAVAVSGCGGGGGGGPDTGGDSMMPVDPQPPLQAAIERARVAETEAFSSAAQAAIRCDSVPEACAAAGTAADQAFLAEAAREEAEASTTVARAERAAAAAEFAAMNAAEAAAEAIRIAGETTPIPPTTPGSVGWLFPGTTASTNARSDAEAAINAVTSLYTREGYRTRDHDRFGAKGWTPAPTAYVDVFTNRYDPGGQQSYMERWGYWTHPSMSSEITKVQSILEHDPNSEVLEKYRPIYKRIMGLMTNGYFGINYGEAQNITDDFGPTQVWDSSYAAFYSARSTPIIANQHINIDGASWSGDALGIEKASEAPVFGSSLLIIIGGDNYDYGGNTELLLDIHWNNNENIQITAEGFANDDGSRLTGAPFESPGYNSEGRKILSGHFAGANADEAFGVFDAHGYIGAFGAKRQ